MNGKPLSRAAMAAVLLLLAFPQLSETIYAPVLPRIAAAFAVAPGMAQWAVSIDFAAFAVGVLFWGRLSDLQGRRPALLAGLACYALAALLALAAGSFGTLLLARALQSFGAACGSIVVQTMLRDRFQGAQLAAVFSTIVAVLALSPAVGPPLGAMLASRYGVHGVLVCLAALSLVFLLCGASLPETRPAHAAAPAPLLPTAWRMTCDRQLWSAAWLVAGFNLILFGYYTIAPFTLNQLQMPDWMFGASGILIAVAGGLGARLNRRGLLRHSPAHLTALAALGALLSSALQWMAMTAAAGHPLAAALAMLGTQMLLVLAFACAIPNVLASALSRYRDVQGTAGALFGLAYYLMLSAGLGLLSALYRPQPMFQPVFMLLVSAAIMPCAVLARRQAALALRTEASS
ncbi:MFS transporter [Pseudoduganella sp. R-34]|uniref:MFS transporter n=1 Tax=Pseudoduganella sp. R-34 TaxID=3404062 RepID=UPI003CF77273